MSFDWQRFYHLAHTLKNAPSEEYWRTSIGRYYYFAFNKIKEMLETNSDKKFNGPAAHGNVAAEFAFHDPIGSTALGSLRKLRNFADYDPNRAITQKQAEQAKTFCDLALATL